MKKTGFISGVALIAAVLLSGCAAASPESFVTPQAVVRRTTSPVTLDGRLDEPAWRDAVRHDLVSGNVTAGLTPREAERAARDAFQPGWVKFLYDDDFLYVGAELQDGDIINSRAEDQTRLFRYGDLLELFLKPRSGNCCWELYAAPNGAKTSFFYPGCSMIGQEDIYEEDPARLMAGFAVKVRVDGTLNRRQDRDVCWRVEMRIPLRELARSTGVAFAPGQEWVLLAGRGNRGRDLYVQQSSTYPPLPGRGFHQHQYYAPVEFR